jgi:hypothetical protein
MQLYNNSIRALLSSIVKSVLASELLKIVSYSRISLYQLVSHHFINECRVRAFTSLNAIAKLTHKTFFLLSKVSLKS